MTVNKNISLYIPHVFENIDEKKIITIFGCLRLGKVNHVDFVAKMGEKGVYKSAYVHFDFWFDTVAAVNFQERLQSNKETRLVYDDPWYWVVLENSAKKHDINAPKQRIDLSGLKEDKNLENSDEVLNEVKINLDEESEAAAGLMEEDIISVQSDFTDIAEVCDEGCFDYVDAGYVALLEEENKRLYNELQKFKAQVEKIKTNHLKQVLGIEII